MRVRVGNPFRDQHYLADPTFSMRVYEFVTHSGTNPHDVALAIENVVPELTIYGRGSMLKQRRYDPTYTNPQTGTHWVEEEVVMQDGQIGKQGWVNGAVWTSWHQADPEADPCLHVAIGLYNKVCKLHTCRAGHMNDPQRPVVYQKAPPLAQWQLDAIKEEVGEHPSYRLGLSREQDQYVLTGLGFLPLDAPLRDEDVPVELIHRAMDVLARSDERLFVYKAMELVRLGYPVDIELIQHIARARKIELAA